MFRISYEAALLILETTSEEAKQKWGIERTIISAAKSQVSTLRETPWDEAQQLHYRKYLDEPRTAVEIEVLCALYYRLPDSKAALVSKVSTYRYFFAKVLGKEIPVDAEFLERAWEKHYYAGFDEIANPTVELCEEFFKRKLAAPEDMSLGDLAINPNLSDKIRLFILKQMTEDLAISDKYAQEVIELIITAAGKNQKSLYSLANNMLFGQSFRYISQFRVLLKNRDLQPKVYRRLWERLSEDEVTKRSAINLCRDLLTSIRTPTDVLTLVIEKLENWHENGELDDLARWYDWFIFHLNAGSDGLKRILLDEKQLRMSERNSFYYLMGRLELTFEDFYEAFFINEGVAQYIIKDQCRIPRQDFYDQIAIREDVDFTGLPDSYVLKAIGK